MWWSKKTPAYERASTTLSMANARIQFSLSQNVQVSQYALDVLEAFEDEMMVGDDKPCIAYRREGNLFLINEENQDEFTRSYEMQKNLGCDIEWWDPGEIVKHYPLYNPKGYLAGTFGPKDGHFDAVRPAYGNQGQGQIPGRGLHPRRSGRGPGRPGRGQRRENWLPAAKYRAPMVINCAGAWCSMLAATVNIDLPVTPVARQIFVVDSAVKPQGPLPLTILPSGLYFRTENRRFDPHRSKSMDEDQTGINFNWDPKRFTDRIWPEIWDFVPAFDRLKLIRGWAGLYAVNTLDANAILGEWPELKGFYLANGFFRPRRPAGPGRG